MKWLVGIPYRGGDRWRERNADYVTNYLDKNVTTNYSLGDSEATKPFSRSQARNLLARRAIVEGFDVVIFHDADMFAPPEAYKEAAEEAYYFGAFVVAFTEYRPLDQTRSKKVIEGKLDPWGAPAVQVLTAWSLGGIVAIRTDVFAEVGGYDERFVGWGCEDWAFAVACGIVTGKATRRTANAAVHLWHPHGQYSARSKDLTANNELLRRYTAARSVQDLRLVQAFDVVP